MSAGIKRALIIVNSGSGQGLGENLAQDAANELRLHGWRVEIFISPGPDDSTRQARECADEFDVIFSCGGDGTLNAIISGIVDRDVVVGVIPAGTANDLARTVGMSLEPAKAIAELPLCRPKEIDLMEIDGGEAWSVVAIGAGVDARTVQRARNLDIPLNGRARYIAAVVTELREDIITPMIVEVDGEVWDGDALLVQVANCPNHGGGMKIAPGARIDDGRLNVVLVEAMSHARALELIPLIYLGRHLDLPEVRTWSATGVKISKPSVGPVLIDGEIQERSSITVRTAPSRVCLWAPAAG